MIRYKCNHCAEEIESNYPVCNVCATKTTIRNIGAAVQHEVDEIMDLAKTINLADATFGELRAYRHIQTILEKL